MKRPSAMPHDDFVSLSKSKKRNVPNIEDRIILKENEITLIVRFNQALYKVDDHGCVHELSYEVLESGATKTEKSEENTLKMMDSIEAMVGQAVKDGDIEKDSIIRWDGTFQGGTNRQYPAIHIIEPETRRIVTFRQDTRKFITTCIMTEEEWLEIQGDEKNFGDSKGWFSGQVRNVPPKTPLESFSVTGAEQTPVNSFEQDVQQITPVNNFENDIINSEELPIDSSSD